MKHLTILFTLLLLLSSCSPAGTRTKAQASDLPDTFDTQEITTAAEKQLPLTDEQLTALLTPKDGEVLLLGQIMYISQQDRASIIIEHAGGEPFDPATLKLGDIIAFRSGEGAVLQETAPARMTGILREIVVLGRPVG